MYSLEFRLDIRLASSSAFSEDKRYILGYFLIKLVMKSNVYAPGGEGCIYI